MYSTLPPSSEPLADIAVTLGLLALTFGILLGVSLFATVRAEVPGYADEQPPRDASDPRRRRR
ncbi:hypothetical protein EGH21_11980 [Halomicroarcula sp. F13]|uniref:Uncharacterized protein n=1 Tax=Haloarcula rubra TaxID=2487747 RepID=A0AAW4PRI8_9EURY|nr:hypothetical protein [Halomicroarcula rubra]MBX0323747.1 hypothetical protein [Halomicroarcula rubra]